MSGRTILIVMQGAERSAWLLRGIGQATAYIALCVAVIELLRREGVVRFDVFSGRMLTLVGVLWVVMAIYRAMRERVGAH